MRSGGDHDDVHDIIKKVQDSMDSLRNELLQKDTRQQQKSKRLDSNFSNTSQQRESLIVEKVVVTFGWDCDPIKVLICLIAGDFIVLQGKN